MPRQEADCRICLTDPLPVFLFYMLIGAGCLFFAPRQATAQPDIDSSHPGDVHATSDAPGTNTRYIDPKNGLSVEALIQRALQANADLLAARQQMVEAQGLRRQAGLIPNPGLDISLTNGSILGSQGEREIAVGYAHTFELGGKRGRRIAVTQLGIDQTRQALTDRERLLRADIATQYSGALAAARNLFITEALYQITKQNHEMTEAQAREGETSRLDLGLLQVEFKRLEADRVLFESQVDRAILALKPLAGMPPEDSLRLAGDLHAPPVTLTLDKALTRALEVRPDLRAVRLDAEREQAAVRLAGANGVPDLIGFVQYTRSEAAFDQLGLTPSGTPTPLRDTDNALTAGVSFTLPFFNRNQGNRHAAQARYDAAEYRAQYAEQVVRQDVRAAYSRYTAAGQALGIFDHEVMTQALNNLRIMREAYRLGEVRLLDVIAEQRRLIETQRAYTDVLKEYYLARVDLERAVGEPIE